MILTEVLGITCAIIPFLVAMLIESGNLVPQLQYSREKKNIM